MNDKKDNNAGCGKALLYLAAIVFVVTILGAASDGILDVLSVLPWYGNLVLSIGFFYIMYKIFD